MAQRRVTYENVTQLNFTVFDNFLCLLGSCLLVCQGAQLMLFDRYIKLSKVILICLNSNLSLKLGELT
jgi:hypothetical protein